MALVSTQSLTETSTRIHPEGKGRLDRETDNFTAICVSIIYVENVGASTPHNSMGLQGLLQGWLYLSYSSGISFLSALRILVSVSAYRSFPCRNTCSRIRVSEGMRKESQYRDTHESCSDVARPRKLHSWADKEHMRFGCNTSWRPRVLHLLPKKVNTGMGYGYETRSHCSLIGLPFNVKCHEKVQDQKNWCACARCTRFWQWTQTGDLSRRQFNSPVWNQEDLGGSNRLLSCDTTRTA
jgi:hypothetical protein